jgi:RimJ/RimL family protein N-acetyltransferase
MVAAAQLWLISQRATKLVVVTQAENAPARRIYERSGCTLVRAEQGYHFWPQAAASAR